MLSEKPFLEITISKNPTHDYPFAVVHRNLHGDQFGHSRDGQEHNMRSVRDAWIFAHGYTALLVATGGKNIPEVVINERIGWKP